MFALASAAAWHAGCDVRTCIQGSKWCDRIWMPTETALFMSCFVVAASVDACGTGVVATAALAV